MKFNYSSMYIHDRINSFSELKNKIDTNLIELILDTNICIYLRDFYKEPNSITKRNEIWGELQELLKHIETNNLLVTCSLGVEEACRNKDNFTLNYDKMMDMGSSIQSVFDMNYFEMLEHSKLIKNSNIIKDMTLKTSTKMDSLESASTFQRLLFVNYACLLKMVLLEENQQSRSNVDLMIDYLDFVEREVKVYSAATTLFAHCYFSGNRFMRKLIRKTKNIAEEKLHAIWNASMDLTFPALVSKKIQKSKVIPVFVTSDERLWMLFDSMKTRIFFTNGNDLAFPPTIEIDLSISDWTNSEIRIIDNHNDKILKRIMQKHLNNKFDQEEVLDNLRLVCFKLEEDLIAKFTV